MSVFEPITLTWKGVDYKVAPDKAMGLISEIEDKISLRRLVGSDVPFGKVAMAYGAALRYAGAKVEDDEIYASLFGDKGAGIVAAVTGLIALMIPPSKIAKEAGDIPEKKGKRIKGS